ncbi:MAG TPA: signal peptidase I [Solirubrobacteraceae bacterium]|nr:signal peptidase I [Solirubrobacteraceae bacterium]
MRLRARSAAGSVVELLIIVAVAVGLAFAIQDFIVKPYKIPSGSMEPTLIPGQRVLVSRITMDFGAPSVGDIVVFHPPQEAERMLCGPIAHAVVSGGSPCAAPIPEQDGAVNYIKRIVAGPGEELFVSKGRVYRCKPRSSTAKCAPSEFKTQPEPFIRPCDERSECNFPVPIKVPAGHWFMMGDNRGNSDDSRYWGPVPTSWIVGEAFATYWPPDRIGTL